jgi:phosphoglycolate phosphatase-like HAD superfamily hydrolase
MDPANRSVRAVNRLLLWDVDHTLIENSGVSKEIYSAAFAELTSRASISSPVTSGKTDRLIMRDMFSANNMPTPAWPSIEKALGNAGRKYADDLHSRGRMLPGVAALMNVLQGRPDITQTIVTGNVRANAFVKLSTFDLDVYFDFDIGGYGSDSESRPDLVRCARERAARAAGVTFDASNTIVIGDTPRDVEAAHLGGAQIIAVATGVDSEAALRGAGADIVVADLADTGSLVDLLVASSH